MRMYEVLQKSEAAVSSSSERRDWLMFFRWVRLL